MVQTIRHISTALVMAAVLFPFAEAAVCQTSGVPSGNSTLPSTESVPADLVFIDSLAVVTDVQVPEEAWRQRILSAPGIDLNEGLVAHDREVIANVFREHGYWQASVTTGTEIVDTKATLTFTVHAGQPVILGTVSLKGPEAIESWTTASPPKSGAVFASGILEPFIASIVEGATRDGYPDVQVIPVLSARGDTVDVALAVTPGMMAVVDSVTVSGLTRTRDEVVLRELSSLHGLPANAVTIEIARSLIGTLDIVTNAGDPLYLYPVSGSAILALRLAEGPQGSFDGVLGYQPTIGEGEGELIGMIDLEFPNLAGTGRSTAIHWEDLGTDTEDIAVSYREPWIIGLPYSFAGSFMQERRNRLNYTRTVMQWSVSRVFGNLEAEGGYRYEKISADSLTSSSGHGIDLSARWTQLDNYQNPRSGIRYGAAWSRLAKSYRFGARADHILERTEFDLDHFVPTLTGQAMAFIIRYRRVDVPGNISLADRYWLGGTNSIRGYREQSFPAVEAIWANVEYRFIQSGRSRVFVFFDHGYLVNEETNVDGITHDKTRAVSGYGFGLRIGSRAGMLGFDFGLGEGDAFGDSKLHVSLSNYF